MKYGIIGFVAVFGVWLAGLVSAGETERYQPPAGDTVTLNFNSGWRLAKGSFPVGRTDDSVWERVSTPHTYHEKEAFQYNGLTSGSVVDAEGRGKDTGPFTYRKHFKIPAEYAGRRLILEFQGIRQRGQFYLNGKLIGRDCTGCAPFGFDITDAVKFGAENILHAEIDCLDKEFETDALLVWSHSSLNPLYGGICRNVFLHVMPRVHATLPLYSSLKNEGTYVYAEEISTEKRSAVVGIEVQVRNDATEARTAECSAVLVDREGRAVATFECKPAVIEAGKMLTFKASRKLEGLHFWQPGYPYLYTVYTIVRSGDGKPDVKKVTTGFRKLEVRGAELFVNNRVLMTHGYAPNSQNELAAVGNACPDWVQDYKTAMIIEGISTLVRWLIIMPAPKAIESCDRYGLPQIMPGADREGDNIGRTWEMRKEIMRNTIIYCRNSPSVFLWEAANNILTKEHTLEMIAVRDQWDPRGSRRPMGGRCVSPEWTSRMYGTHVERDRLSVDTEYMRDESPRRWWDAWSPPYLHPDDSRIAENGGFDRNQDNFCRTQAAVYERYYKARPGTGELICNGGVQIFFSDGDSFKRGCDLFRRSGVTDAMLVPKDAYFCNKAMRANTPELWTAGRCEVFLPGHWNYPAGTLKPVYVFVSPGVEKVELRVNGKAIVGGVRTNLFQFTFPAVTWEAGTIEAIGFDAAGREVARSSHITAGEPASLHLSVIQGPGGLRADGSDLALVQTEVVDKSGRRCPLAQHLISYEVSGPAGWRGGYWEEDARKYANRKELPVINGIHRVIVRSTEQPGVITIKAHAPGVQSAVVEIAAREVPIHDGLGRDLPAVKFPTLAEKVVYGPDLKPAPARKPTPYDFLYLHGDGTKTRDGAIIRNLASVWLDVRIGKAAKNGVRVYAPRLKEKNPLVFTDLPDYLQGVEYVMNERDHRGRKVAEGMIFYMGKPGKVYVAYDERHGHFPTLGCPTQFKRTPDRITVEGHPLQIYESDPMKEGDIMYIGSNNWPDDPVKDAFNYVVFVKPLIQ